MRTLTIKMHRYEVTLGCIYILLQIFIIPSFLIFANSFLSRPLSAAALNFVCFAINFICVTVIFHQYLVASFHLFIKQLKRNFNTCLKGFVFYCLSSILVNALVIILDSDFSNVNDTNIAQLANQNVYLIAIGTVFLVPTVEETLYRGVVFGQLYQKNPILGYTISVVTFSALHIIGYIGHYSPFRLFLCFLQYIPAGIILAWTYVKSDTIWAPIVIHMTVNLIGMLIM